MVHNSVRSLLTEQSLVVLSPGQTVFEAAAIFSAHNIGGAPVLDGGRLVGVFTERDTLRRVVALACDPKATRVADVMTSDPRTIDAGTSLVNAFAIMSKGQFRHLPVVGDDGTVVAMLSMRDIPAEYRIMHRQWVAWTAGSDAFPAAAI